MVTQLNRNLPAREAGYEMVQYLCARILANSTATLLVRVGTLPAGSIPIWIVNRVVTAFTGGTPLLTIGSNATTYNNLNATLAEAAANELVQPLATFAAPFTVDTEIWASLSGGPVTAGDGYIIIGFVKPLA